jgi:hypothetical protein
VFEWVRPDVELVRDVSVSDWIVSTLEPWSREGVRLNSFMPAGFQTHARVLHPFREWDGVSVTWRRWRDVGAERELVIGPETTAEEVAGVSSPEGGPLPEEGQLPDPTCRSLVGILTVETRTPETCWFALWNGWGILGGSSALSPHPGPTWNERRRQRVAKRKENEILDAIPKITEPHQNTGRSYLLFRGPIDAACSFEPMKGHFVRPSLWWPEDRAWAAVTEIDGYSTYVGGDRRTVDAILGSQELEAIEVSREVRID